MKNYLILASILFVQQGFAQSDSAAFYKQKADADNESRRYLTSFKYYQKSLSFDSSNVDVHRGLGKVALELRRYDIARISWEHVLKAAPNDTAAMVNLTTVYFNTRKWNDAMQMAQKAQAANVGHNNNLIIAKSFYELENYGQALKFLELAYRDDPKNPEIPYMGGRSFVEMSNYKKALGCYEQVLALDSSKAQWYYEAAMVAYAIPDDKKALDYFEKAAAHGQKRTNDYLENVANCYMNLKNYPKAIPIMEELLQRKPADMDILYNMGDTYYRSSKYDQAIATWDKMLAIDDKNANALYMIGVAYQKKGEKEKGQALCDKAIQMDPNLAKNKVKKENMGF